ncbi:Protein virB10 [biofilm metagenome]
MNNNSNEIDDDIGGERNITSVTRSQTVQAKINSILGVGLLLLFGFGFLYWYYANAFGKQERLDEAKRKQLEQQTKDEGALPKLGNIPFPSLAQPSAPVPTDTVEIGDIYTPPQPNQQPQANQPQGQKQKTPQELAEERRLAGGVFKRIKDNEDGSNGDKPSVSGVGVASVDGRQTEGGKTALSEYLKPTVTATALAKKLPNQTYVIPKGTKGDCTTETAIDSQLPGMVTCVLAFDIFGANGNVVLLERGTQLTGETRSGVQQGQNRVFVLWSEARTPTGVIAYLDSPATDSLGRSGIAGEVDNHFWDRFGAAILISVLNGAMQAGSSYASAAGSDGGTNINYNPQGANGVMTEILRNTVNIPPTISVRQGERVQILFARDVDFRPVYTLAERQNYNPYPIHK